MRPESAIHHKPPCDDKIADSIAGFRRNRTACHRNHRWRNRHNANDWELDETDVIGWFPECDKPD